MNILRAIKDPNLFRPFLGEELGSWWAWNAALRCVYGMPIKSRRHRNLVLECTGRDADGMPDDGFDTALFLTGRRSGKSRIAATVAAYEAALGGHESKLAPGETGYVAVIAPTRSQSRIVRDYVRAAMHATDILWGEVVKESREGFTLRNGVRIEILTGDWRSVRGYTLLAVVVDEAAFFGLDEDSRVRSDTELVRALKPALATTGGKLIAITTPYARKGWTWSTYQRHHGTEGSPVLVWNCPSRTMNPTLPQDVVDQALREDLASAKAEYLGEFRDDVVLWLPPEVIDGCTIAGRSTLLPRESTRYFAFADVSGGRSDDSAIAIAHQRDRTIVIDAVRRWGSPHDPNRAIDDMADMCREYGIRSVTGDNYSAEFVAQAFRRHGIRYEPARKNKSELYLELLPRMCSREIELPDDRVLLSQLRSLERRTRSGGRDIVDHPPGQHDDVANCVAGVAFITAKPARRVGGIPSRRTAGARSMLAAMVHQPNTYTH